MPRKKYDALWEKHGGVPSLEFFAAVKRWFRAKGFRYPKAQEKNLNHPAPDLLVRWTEAGWEHDVTE